MAEEILEDEIDVTVNREVKYDDCAVSIKISPHRYHEKSLKRSADILRKLKTVQALGTDDVLETIVDRVFVEGIKKTVYVVDMTFTTQKGALGKRIYIRPRVFEVEDDFVYNLVGKGNSIRFVGTPIGKDLCISQVQVILNDEMLDYEAEATIIPYKDQSRIRYNFFNVLLDNTESLARYTEQKLVGWEDYLQWSKAVAERQLAGCRYYEVSYTRDRDKPLLIFGLIFENEEAFKNIKKSFSKGMEVFDGAYSKDEWKFEFAGGEDERGRRRQFDKERLGRFYRVIGDNHYLNGGVLRSEVDRSEIDLSACPFDNPYIVHAAYELAEDDAEKAEDMDEGSLDDFMYDEVLPRYILQENEAGFLALSGVSAFVLIRRFENAIGQLKRNETDSPNLPLWLFDATKARLPEPDEIPIIDRWLDPQIMNNDNQRQAVIKILSAPDLCLIQGPPGTGKTTVIAEAIYQLALQGKRVLLASQSNDAVDNALERLGSNPSIRAIRLTNSKRSKKKDEAGSKYTEDTALKYFYRSIADNVDKRWVERWKGLETTLNECKKDLRDAKFYKEDIATLNGELDENGKALQRSQEELRRLEEESASAEEFNRKRRASLYNCDVLKQNVFEGRDNDFNLADQKIFELIAHALNPAIEAAQQSGLLPTLRKIDIQNPYLNEECGIVMMLNRYLNSIERLTIKIRKFEGGSGGDNAELQNLKMKRDELDENEPLDEESDEHRQWERERRKVNRRINELKSSAGNLVARLDSAERDLLSEVLLKDLETDRRNAIADRLEQMRSEFKKAFDRLFMELDGFFDRNPERDLNEIGRRYKVEIGNNDELKKERRSLLRQREEKQQTLQTLRGKYNASDESEDAVTDRIGQVMQEAQRSLDEDRIIREHWQGALEEYCRRLRDERSALYDQKFYREIYLRSCNVVGTSCTADMRNFDEIGFNDFDVAIIDEVSKATPPELLLPLMKARRAVLVGDHRQLPPMFGENEKSYKDMVEDEEDIPEELRELLTLDNYKRFKKMVTSALFKEFFEQADEAIKHRLEVQYRMHRDIMGVSNRFYESRLKAGLTIEQEKTTRAHGLTLRGVGDQLLIKPERHAYWFDSSTLPDATAVFESRRGQSTSACNIAEQHIIIKLLKKIAEECAALKIKKTIGVISFYQLQINDLRSTIKNLIRTKAIDLSYLSLRLRDINTVDRFQGQERQIIITSLVRNKRGENLGEHTLAFERINVAFSRAQELLVIVGAESLFSKQNVTLPNMDSEGEYTVPIYRNIIDELKRQAAFVPTDKILSVDDVQSIKNEINAIEVEKKNAGGDKR